MSEAHPRSRGEHRFGRRRGDWKEGSSPLTRGAPQVPLSEMVNTGLIPAHAGSTKGTETLLLEGTAHPRSRGEHACAMLILWSAVGSSPLTRGARHQSGHRHGLHGLIPAHAGSTSYRVRPAPVRPAHPRSRGEHAGVDFSHCLVAGSSPLTRGAPCPQASLCSVWGLIPAHAGSTKCLFISFTRSGAHPRSRGEHSVCDGF